MCTRGQNQNLPVIWLCGKQMQEDEEFKDSKFKTSLGHFRTHPNKQTLPSINRHVAWAVEWSSPPFLPSSQKWNPSNKYTAVRAVIRAGDMKVYIFGFQVLVIKIQNAFGGTERLQFCLYLRSLFNHRSSQT